MGQGTNWPNGILPINQIRSYVSASNGVRLSIMLLGTSQIFHASHRIRSHCSAVVSCHWAKYLYTKCAEILSRSRFSDHSSKLKLYLFCMYSIINYV